METKRRTLLLADDSLTIQKVVSLTFTDEGMEVLTFGTGDEVMRFLEESGPPDVVLADVHMPGMSGYEVCERIKRDERWRHVPVMLLAGAFEPFNEAEARRVGADEVLSKPFQSIKGLIGKVSALLGGKGADEETRSDERRPGGQEPVRAARAGAHASTHAATPEGVAHGAEAPAPARTFADFGMDDEMIEATPAERFGQNAEPLHTRAAEATEAHVHAAGTDARADERREETAYAEHREEPVYAAARGEVTAEAHAGRNAFAARAASAAAADDALLDLGLVEPSTSTADPDDFVLDLDFDEPPRPAPTAWAASAPATHDEAEIVSQKYEGTSQEYESASPGYETTPQFDGAGAFAEAAHGAGDAQETAAAPARYDFQTEPAGRDDASPAPRDFVEPQVVASDEPVRMGEDLSVEGDVARAPFAASAPEVADATGAQGYETASVATREAAPEASAAAASAASALTLEQLSPEVIDAIARRAVELMSERVVQEIAWEVVPELAERMIRQRLDQQK